MMFCSCELLCRSVECVLLNTYAQPYIFAIANCAYSLPRMLIQ